MTIIDEEKKCYYNNKNNYIFYKIKFKMLQNKKYLLSCLDEIGTEPNCLLF